MEWNAFSEECRIHGKATSIKEVYFLKFKPGIGISPSQGSTIGGGTICPPLYPLG